ncbi:uncharacterized transmembrane protein DDB_G0289901-like [Scaptodrosophila lebanonensis]|uniref:Uncharacterized transmembrane protein DDB_G0289901-like n=1 Tax=Drosophila lebanonensis TaxID=7225 RepID=A0A6J2U9X1_DROLE|nr:uncharacterized transmembrane protein DDB_G0289901-like [Scaptodrosophila lebanonensis]
MQMLRRSYQLAVALTLLYGVTSLSRVVRQNYRRTNSTWYTPGQTHQRPYVNPINPSQPWYAQPNPFNNAGSVHNPGRYNQTWIQQPGHKNHAWSTNNQTWSRTTPQSRGAFNTWSNANNASAPGRPLGNHNWNSGDQRGPTTPRPGGVFNGWAARNNFSAPANNGGNINSWSSHNNSPGPTYNGGNSNNWGTRNNVSIPANNGGNFGGWGARTNSSGSNNNPWLSGGTSQHQITPRPMASGINGQSGPHSNAPASWGARSNSSGPNPWLSTGNNSPGSNFGNNPWLSAGSSQHQTTPKPIASGINGGSGSHNNAPAGWSPVDNNWQQPGPKQQHDGQPIQGVHNSPLSPGNSAPLAPLGGGGWQSPQPSGSSSGSGVPLAPLGQYGGNQAGLSYPQAQPGAPSRTPNSSNPYANLFN